MSNSPSNKRQKVNNADILSPNIHDYARAAKNDKIVTAVNRFNQFLKEITNHLCPDSLEYSSLSHYSQKTFDQLSYEDFCNSVLFGVYFKWLASKATYINNPNKLLSYNYVIGLSSTLKEHILNLPYVRDR